MDFGTDSLFASATRNIRRFRKVASIIARHGFAEIFTKSALGKSFFNEINVKAEGGPGPSASRLRDLIEELGPTYIKFGQILSVRHDLLSPDYIAALASLQDQNTPLPFDAIKDRIESDLGAPLSELFREFEVTPLATASIAQTHRACTHDGKKVVVKVQRPGIAEVIRSDLDILFVFAKLLEACIEEMELLAPSEIVAEFERVTLKELDFTLELTNLIKARGFLKADGSIVIPEPLTELSNPTILTMELFVGRSLRKIAPQTPLAKKIAEKLAHSFSQQILLDGFFHSDPHAGNILINDDEVICLIDYGQVGQLTPAQLQEIVGMLLALFSKDVGGVVRSIISIAQLKQRVSLADLRSQVKVLLDKYFSDSNLVAANPQEMIEDLVSILRHHHIKPPRDLVIVVKSIATIQGVIRHLHPDIAAGSILLPYIKEAFAKRFSPENVLQETINGISGLAHSLRVLPGQLDQILSDAERGHFQIRIVSPELQELASTLNQIGGKIGLSAFGMTSGIASVLLLMEDNLHDLAVVSFKVSIFSWLVLLLWQVWGRRQSIKVRTLTQFLKR